MKPKTPHLKLGELPRSRLSDSAKKIGGIWYEILEVTNSVGYSVGQEIGKAEVGRLLGNLIVTTKLVRHPRWPGLTGVGR